MFSNLWIFPRNSRNWNETKLGLLFLTVLSFICISGDMLAKPFTFVSGNTKKSRFNPFRKKSGLLNVLARQSTKNRICFKNGYLNTFTPTEEAQTHKFLQVFYRVNTKEMNQCCYFWTTEDFFKRWGIKSESLFGGYPVCILTLRATFSGESL